MNLKRGGRSTPVEHYKKVVGTYVQKIDGKSMVDSPPAGRVPVTLGRFLAWQTRNLNKGGGDVEATLKWVPTSLLPVEVQSPFIHMKTDLVIENGCSSKLTANIEPLVALRKENTNLWQSPRVHYPSRNVLRSPFWRNGSNPAKYCFGSNISAK